MNQKLPAVPWEVCASSPLHPCHGCQMHQSKEEGCTTEASNQPSPCAFQSTKCFRACYAHGACLCRCGEWSHTFLLMLRSAGLDARHVHDHADHVGISLGGVLSGTVGCKHLRSHSTSPATYAPTLDSFQHCPGCGALLAMQGNDMQVVENSITPGELRSRGNSRLFGTKPFCLLFPQLCTCNLDREREG